MVDTDNMLSVLDSYYMPSEEEVAEKLAADFPKRRIEKGFTREEMSGKSGVALANITRFEQKGLISLRNFILLAMAMGYLHDIRDVFASPKYSTMEELMQIR